MATLAFVLALLAPLIGGTSLLIEDADLAGTLFLGAIACVAGALATGFAARDTPRGRQALTMAVIEAVVLAIVLIWITPVSVRTEAPPTEQVDGG